MLKIIGAYENCDVIKAFSKSFPSEKLKKKKKRKKCMTQIYKVVNGNCPTNNELAISISKYEFNIRNF